VRGAQRAARAPGRRRRRERCIFILLGNAKIAPSHTIRIHLVHAVWTSLALGQKPRQCPTMRFSCDAPRNAPQVSKWPSDPIPRTISMYQERHLLMESRYRQFQSRSPDRWSGWHRSQTETGGGGSSNWYTLRLAWQMWLM
jgi:hypothetical protein